MEGNEGRAVEWTGTKAEGVRPHKRALLRLPARVRHLDRNKSSSLESAQLQPFHLN